MSIKAQTNKVVRSGLSFENDILDLIYDIENSNMSESNKKHYDNKLSKFAEEISNIYGAIKSDMNSETQFGDVK